MTERAGGLKVLGLDHVSIAVPDLDEAICRWSELLGRGPSGVEEVEDERVRVALFALDGGSLELVAPVGEASPIAGFLARRGSGIHHICLRVSDARAAWKALEGLGAPLLGEGPHEGAGGGRIFFLHPKALGGVLVELKEE